jgi:hypothetical protein
LVATVLGDHLHAPRGHPDPVDHPLVDQSLECSLSLIFDDVRQGQAADVSVISMVKESSSSRCQPIDQPEIDHVDTKLRIDNVLQRFFNFLKQLLIVPLIR